MNKKSEHLVRSIIQRETSYLDAAGLSIEEFGSDLDEIYKAIGQAYVNEKHIEIQSTNFDNRADWEQAVKKHAHRIRRLIPDQVFGMNIGNNKDALIVAIYLKGVEEGRNNSEMVLKEMLKKRNIDLEKML